MKTKMARWVDDVLLSIFCLSLKNKHKKPNKKKPSPLPKTKLDAGFIIPLEGGTIIFNNKYTTHAHLEPKYLNYLRDKIAPKIFKAFEGFQTKAFQNFQMHLWKFSSEFFRKFQEISKIFWKFLKNSENFKFDENFSCWRI